MSAVKVVDTQYESLLLDVMAHGEPKTDRTGTGTRSLFGTRLEYDLSLGFPRITTKFVAMKAVKAELLWFLSGSTDNNDLRALGSTIWDEWAGPDGDLGPIYGQQWRGWRTYGGGEIDQLATLVDTLVTDPDSRRMCVSAWNVAQLRSMVLYPCHAFFQCYVAQGRLSLQVYQRSADMFLGVPFNIASYALLTHMLAQQTGYELGRLVWVGGDTHLYDNHREAAARQLVREPRPFPTLRLRRAPDLFSYEMGDIDASDGYDPWPAIPAPVAV